MLKKKKTARATLIIEMNVNRRKQRLGENNWDLASLLSSLLMKVHYLCPLDIITICQKERDCFFVYTIYTFDHLKQMKTEDSLSPIGVG